MWIPINRYRPKGVLGKGVGNNKNASEMRQKCVENAPKWVLFYREKRNVPKCVRNVSKMRGTPLGENTFWMTLNQLWESLRELLREFWLSYCLSRGMPFREWNFVFREWKFEFRELLREYPGTRALRMAFSLRERFS